MSFSNLVHSMRYGGGGGGYRDLLGGGRDNFFSSGWQRNSSSILSSNPFGSFNPIGGLFSELRGDFFHFKHGINNHVSFSGRPSGHFDLGNELGDALRETISRIGGGLMSQGARLGNFGFGNDDVRVFGRFNPIQHFMQDIARVFNR